MLGMQEVKNVAALAGLPQWVVIRTADEVVAERRGNLWFATGVGSPIEFSPEQFPATVLWSYAMEMADPKDLEVLGQLIGVLSKAQGATAGLTPTGGEITFPR